MESTRMPASDDRTTNPWAAGIVIFAGVILFMIGCYQIITGLAAILKGEFFVVTPNYVYAINVSAWGWIHLLLGIVMLLIAWGAIMGQLWARIAGIVIATLSAIVNFFFIPYYPLWSILIIVLDVFVIWALCVHGHRSAKGVGLTA